MVLFILFPGVNDSGKIFEKYIDYKTKKIIKTNFLQKLKKIGDVYTYTPNIYNITNNCVCNSECKLNKKILFSNPKKITINDIDIDKECKRIYKEVRSYKGKIIPIGHSAGGWFAVHFSKLYKSKCIKIILIESGYLTSKLAKWQIELKTKKKTYPNITTTKLQELVKKLQTNRSCNKKSTKKLENNLNQIYMYYYLKTIKKINGKLLKPTLFFENIENKINKKHLNYYDELYKKNGKKIKIIYFTNTFHLPWHIQRYSDEMIRQIKCFI
jgi:hypothetical protein